MSTVSPRLLWISFRQSSMTVSVVRPRKSIFSRPIFSMAFMSYAVTISSFFARVMGTSSVSGCGAITTPAACTPAPRTSPSRRMAASISSLISGVESYAWPSCGESFSAASSVMPIVAGTIFAMRSTSP